MVDRIRALYVVSDPTRVEQLSDGACDASDQDEMLRQFLSSFTGGFTSPLKHDMP